MLEPRRAALSRRLRIAFAVIDDQPYLFDTGMREMLSTGWHEDVDLVVLSNAQTLIDLVAGEFEYANPRPHHLFFWGGDEEVWRALAAALEGGRSLLNAQMDAIRARNP